MMSIARSTRFGARSLHWAGRTLTKNLPNPWVLATGKELWEAIQHKKGNTDPFLMDPVTRGPGTRECPNVILSADSQRLVGCVCDDDVNHIKWFWVHENCPRRCYCNYWFVLERFEMPKFYEEPCCPE